MSSKWIIRLRSLLLFWGVVFLVTGMVFLFRAEAIFSFLNGLGHFLQLPLEPVLAVSEVTGGVLAPTLATVLVYACFYASVDLRRRLAFVHVILLFAFVAALLCLSVFLLKNQALAYLAGFLAAGTVFISTYFPYARIRRERRLMGL